MRLRIARLTGRIL